MTTDTYLVRIIVTRPDHIAELTNLTVEHATSGAVMHELTDGVAIDDTAGVGVTASSEKVDNDR